MVNREDRREKLVEFVDLLIRFRRVEKRVWIRATGFSYSSFFFFPLMLSKGEGVGEGGRGPIPEIRCVLERLARHRNLTVWRDHTWRGEKHAKGSSVRASSYSRQSLGIAVAAECTRHYFIVPSTSRLASTPLSLYPRTRRFVFSQTLIDLRILRLILSSFYQFLFFSFFSLFFVPPSGSVCSRPISCTHTVLGECVTDNTFVWLRFTKSSIPCRKPVHSPSISIDLCRSYDIQDLWADNNLADAVGT